MFEEFDKHVSVWTESFARKFNRRKAMGTTVKGLFATVAAATVGELVNVGQAFAATCTCDDGWTTGVAIGDIPAPTLLLPPHSVHRAALPAIILVAMDGVLIAVVTGSHVATLAWCKWQGVQAVLGLQVQHVCSQMFMLEWVHKLLVLISNHSAFLIRRPWSND